MRYSQARQGRIFVIRLEDGDILHEQIEDLARKEGIASGVLVIVGGADRGSRLVSGPLEGRAAPIVPMESILEDVHEAAGTGTLFPDDEGNPVVHVHLACGRKGDPAQVGCIRSGVAVWQVMEVVLLELLDSSGVRRPDEATGFKLLDP